jgi:hypothetical protein
MFIEEGGSKVPPTRRMQWMWQSVMAYDKIKNNERVRGKFSLCETNSRNQSRKEFFPLSTYISIERKDMQLLYAE